MTEVPEHLLRRSRERRESLGLAGGEGAGSPAEAPSGSTPAPAAPASPPAAGAPTPAPAPAPAEPEPEYAPPAPPRRVPVPAWAMPVLALLPFWAIVYVGAFGERETVDPNDPMVIGARVYRSSGCSGCHGPAGEGGVGPALDQTKQTFPNEADMITWIKTGSGPFAGQQYFNSGRVATGGMPGFADSLSEEEIQAVALYERERFGG